MGCHPLPRRDRLDCSATLRLRPFRAWQPPGRGRVLRVDSTLDGGPNGANDAGGVLVACDADICMVVALVVAGSRHMAGVEFRRHPAQAGKRGRFSRTQTRGQQPPALTRAGLSGRTGAGARGAQNGSREPASASGGTCLPSRPCRTDPGARPRSASPPDHPAAQGTCGGACSAPRKPRPPPCRQAVSRVALACPQSDSNRHWADFKSAASANWAMGARRRM